MESIGFSQWEPSRPTTFRFILISSFYLVRGRGSVVGKVTHCSWTVWGSNPVGV
jgi:hypothetical protein